MLGRPNHQFLNLFVLLAVMLLSMAGCQDQSATNLAGGTVGVTEECVGRVQDDDFGFKKLDCKYNCPDGKVCEWQSSTDKNETKRQWCGCSGAEPDNCHAYIEEPKDKPHKVDCTGVCATKGEICTRDVDKKKAVSCACKKKP